MGLYIHDVNSPRPHTGGYTYMMWTLHDLIHGAVHTWCELSTTSYMGLYIHDVNFPWPRTGGYTYMMCCWFYTMCRLNSFHDLIQGAIHTWCVVDFTQCAVWTLSTTSYMGLCIHDVLLILHNVQSELFPRPQTWGYTYMICCWFYTMYSLNSFHDLIQGAVHTWCELSTTSYMGLYIHDVLLILHNVQSELFPRPHTGAYTYMMCCWLYTMYTIKQWKICTNQKISNMRFKYCDLRRVTFFKLDHKSKMANITEQCSTMGIWTKRFQNSAWLTMWAKLQAQVSL
jgi:hypothetical protein